MRECPWFLISWCHYFDHQWFNYIVCPAYTWSLNAWSSTFNLKNMNFVVAFPLDIIITCRQRSIWVFSALCLSICTPHNTAITFHTFHNNFLPWVLYSINESHNQYTAGQLNMQKCRFCLQEYIQFNTYIENKVWTDQLKMN